MERVQFKANKEWRDIKKKHYGGRGKERKVGRELNTEAGERND